MYKKDLRNIDIIILQLLILLSLLLILLFTMIINSDIMIIFITTINIIIIITITISYQDHFLQNVFKKDLRLICSLRQLCFWIQRPTGTTCPEINALSAVKRCSWKNCFFFPIYCNPFCYPEGTGSIRRDGWMLCEITN